MRSSYYVRVILGVICLLVFLGHAGRFWQIPFVTALDFYLYDARVRLTLPDKPDERIAIVDIDEKSLAEIGRWPWSRNIVADLVRKLADDYRVSVIGFDVVFAEPDTSSGLPVLESAARHSLSEDVAFQRALSQLRPALDFDRQLASAFAGRPVVLGYYFSKEHHAKHRGVLPAPTFPPGIFDGRNQFFLQWGGFGANLPELQAAAASAGHFNPVIDSDGSSRRVPILVEYDGGYYESLSLAVVRQWLGATRLIPGFPDKDTSLEWLDIVSDQGTLRVPVDDQVAALVPYQGPAGSFSYYSAVDVLQGRISPEALAGKIILVGTSAPGLMDLRTTPVGGAYPGVEIHANLIAGILSNEIKTSPAYMLAVEVLCILFIGGALVFLLPRMSPLRATVSTALALALFLAFNVPLWNAGLVLSPAACLMLIMIIYAVNMSWGFFVESRSKRQFADLFGQYVPPELVDEMAKDPETYSMAGRNEELTILFSDIRNFTTLSEGMNPRELTQLMNEYLGAMTEIIQAQRGTLDKYIGDAIMAFWGAPMADSEHARHALVTAMAMQRGVKALDDQFVARGWPRIRIGVGINTGLVTVGDMGSKVRKAYTVMGDAVNLASRLEGITKLYGVGVVVGETTRDKVPDFVYRELDRVRVKGKVKPVVIFEPLGEKGQVSETVLEDLRLWQQFLRLYRQQDWDQAELQLFNLQQRDPAMPLYALYAERIARLRQEPLLVDWDGVTVLESK